MGDKAVSLFFVLSGFLISYLLLAEIAKKNRISLRKFYVRRALRIWPVYYLVFGIAFFVLPRYSDIGVLNVVPSEHYGMVLMAYILIFPNLLRASSTKLLGASQAWSVGVEEQFYLIWPILVQLFHRAFVPFIVALIALKFSLQGLFGFLAEYYVGSGTREVFLKIEVIWQLFQIEQMCVGALGAYYFWKYQDLFQHWLSKKGIWVIALCLLVLLLVFEITFMGSSLLEALVFLILILNVSLNPEFPVSLKARFWDKLGNLSYGIYMYHTIAIVLVLTVFKNWSWESNWPLNLFLYPLSFLLTLLMAKVSYSFIEKPILELKKRFQVLKTAI